MNKTKEEIETLANQIWPSATDGTYNDLTKNFPHYRYGFIQAFEYYTDQIKSMEGQVKELRDENEIQGNYNDMLIKELESLQKEAIDFAEWMLTESVKKYGDDKWEIRKYFNLSMTNGNSAYYTSKELYEQFKSTPSQINN